MPVPRWTENLDSVFVVKDLKLQVLEIFKKRLVFIMFIEHKFFLK